MKNPIELYLYRNTYFLNRRRIYQNFNSLKITSNHFRSSVVRSLEFIIKLNSICIYLTKFWDEFEFFHKP